MDGTSKEHRKIQYLINKMKMRSFSHSIIRLSTSLKILKMLHFSKILSAIKKGERDALQFGKDLMYHKVGTITNTNIQWKLTLKEVDLDSDIRYIWRILSTIVIARVKLKIVGVLNQTYSSTTYNLTKKEKIC